MYVADIKRVMTRVVQRDEASKTKNIPPRLTPKYESNKYVMAVVIKDCGTYTDTLRVAKRLFRECEI